MGEIDERVQHPVSADENRHPNRDDLGDERQREFLNLGGRLEHRDAESHTQAGQQHRRAQLRRDDHRLQRDVQDSGIGHVFPVSGNS